MAAISKRDIVDRVLISLIVVLALIAIVSLALKLTGHSPTDITILYSLVAMIIVSSFKVHYDLGKLDEFSNNTKMSFQHMREDNQQLRQEIRELKSILTKTAKRF